MYFCSIPVFMSREKNVKKVYIAKKLMLFYHKRSIYNPDCYILLRWYKQPVSNHKGRSNNVSKTDEDLTWWP